MNLPISMGEVRLALRLIVKQPILSVTIILALATGICLATMGFTLRDEIVNARCHMRRASASARLDVRKIKDGGRIDLDPRALPRVPRSRHVVRAPRRIRREPFTLTHSAKEVESIRGAYITPRSMSWLDASPSAGPQPHSGRWRNRRRTGRVIRESLWRRRYGARSRHHRPAADHRRPAPHRRRHHARHVRIPSSSGELWMPLDEADARRTAHRRSRRRFVSSACFAPARRSNRRPRKSTSCRKRFPSSEHHSR